MKTREECRDIVLDHSAGGLLDVKNLNDRDLLELIFHMLLERRDTSLNTVGAVTPIRD